MSPIEPFVVLLAAHLIGDFVLQTEQMALKKARVLGWLALHATELGAITWILCATKVAFPVVVIVFLTHVVFDWTKPRLPGSILFWYIMDQAGHLIVLWLSAIWLTKQLDFMPLTHWVPFNIQVLFCAFLAVGRPVTIGMGMFLKPWHQEILQLKDVDPEHAPVTGLTRSGAWIGNLERFFVLTCVVVGQPLLIGFLLVAKGVMRYGETSHLEHRKRGDYAIIGTVGSVWLAIAVGYLARLAMN